METIEKLRKTLKNGGLTEMEFIEKLAQLSFENKISLDDCTSEERAQVRVFLMG